MSEIMEWDRELAIRALLPKHSINCLFRIRGGKCDCGVEQKINNAAKLFAQARQEGREERDAEWSKMIKRKLRGIMTVDGCIDWSSIDMCAKHLQYAMYKYRHLRDTLKAQSPTLSASLEEKARDLINFLVEYLGLPAYNQVAAHDKTVQVMTALEAEVREDEREQCLQEAVKKESYLGQEPDPNPLQKNRCRTVTKRRNRTWQEIAKAIRERGRV